jgi:hypothetical protein
MRGWANLLLVMGGIAVSTLLMEGFLRLNDYAPQSLSEATAYHSYEWNGHEHQVFADPNRLKDLRPAILVVGDSFVAGRKCGYESNLTGHMQNAIERLSLPYKVLNLGFPVTSVFTYLSHVEDFTQEYEPPAAVVVVLYSNDIEISDDQALCRYSETIASLGRLHNAGLQRMIDRCSSRPAEHRQRARKEPFLSGGIDRTLYQLSYTYRLLRELIAQVVFKFADVGRMRFLDPWIDPDSAEFQGVLIGLSEIKRLTQVHRVALVIAFYPNVEDLSGQGEMYEAVQQAVHNLSEQLGWEVYNGYEAFRGNPKASSRMVWSLTDVHPSCDAHAIMADWLVQKVLDRI